MIKDAMQKIIESVSAWEGVTSRAHRFGGIEFTLGRRELGHMHGNTLVDIPFPKAIRNELVESGKVLPHHVLPDSGWISFYIKKDEDVTYAIELFKLSYETALKKTGIKNNEH
jgi:Luciferase